MSTPLTNDARLTELRSRLDGLLPRDQHRLRRRIDGARKARDADKIIEAIAADVVAAEQRPARRRAGVPKITYPEALPVSQRKDDILATIRDHPVVIVAGETGSGKTTQLPKICLELGRGITGQIGHTQPRRLAARTVAERIAEELGTSLGEAVGYKVRFSDRSGDDTLVKVMTDGILLAEIQQDRLLRQYDTLIIDEAHERSLNIDFLLGYIKQLLPRRPDLKVIITSATIDPQRFSRHFGDAPVVEVSGRTYPVEVRYRPIVPPESDDFDDAAAGRGEPRDQIDAIVDAVDELRAEGPGDVLVFLSGEREIRDTADALNRLDLPNTEILPLFARLSFADQHRVFQPHTGRRVVLATNVAETSLTVPGIKYVIDPGTARISRYSSRLKVQRLPIEPVSQASANQRKGRCGRTSDGICIRLYGEEDFEGRPEYTEPEILRTNLASVILQMTALGLGDLAAFPFIDPPDRRNVAAGVQLLEELGALEERLQGRGAPEARSGGEKAQLTPLGRRLAQLPVDPRLARMVVEGERNGCVREVMVIAAALSIQDPRERPLDKQAQADQQHARFADKDSDFVAFLNLWQYLRDKQRELSSNQFRKMCRAEYLNYLRVREWQDIYSQLRGALGTPAGDQPAEPLKVHLSLLAGLLSHIGLKDPEKNEYLGARGARFAIFPGSALFRKSPRWVMAAELVETTRLWGRVAARIEPEWVEPLAQHLVKRSYSEPHWEKKVAAVMAMEKVTLYGVPIVSARKVNYGRIDPALSRELFIRHALVEGDWETHHKFFAANRKLLEEVEELEHRARRRDILVDDETLFDFYDKRIPADVVSGRHFDSWWKKARHTQPELLTFDLDLLVNEGASRVSERDFPDTWGPFTLTYQFEPGAEADGVTVHIPLPMLGTAPDAEFTWQVPGLREELVTALIRSLPKALRRNFVPAPDTAREALAEMSQGEGSLLDALERALRRLTGVTVPRTEWGQVPDHLRITFRVVDEHDQPLAEGKDLAALRQRLAPKVREQFAEAATGLERAGLTAWDFGALPAAIERTIAGHTVTAYPSLVDEGDSVAIRVFDRPERQGLEMWAGVRRLLLLGLPSPAKFVQGRLSNAAKLALSRNPHRSAVDLLDDCAACAVDHLMADPQHPGRLGLSTWDEAGFAALRERVRADLVEVTLDVVTTVQRILAAAYEVEQRLSRTGNPVLLPALTDLRQQLGRLIFRGFVTATGWDRLPDLERYLQGMQRRLDKLPSDPGRDRERMMTVQQVQQEYDQLAASMSDRPELREIRWMIEELRVGLFAQALGTRYPISDVRIYRAMDQL